MPTVVCEAVVDAGLGEAFNATHDYDRRKAWDPFAVEYRFADPDQPFERGKEVWVRAHNGLTMTVRYEAFDPPRVVAMQMIEGPWFFRQFTGTWRFQPENDRTRVTFRYGFTARPRLLGPVIRPFLQRDMTRRLTALQHHFDHHT